MSAGRSRFNDAVRREWWIVALTLVVALVIGGLVAMSSSASFLGSATVSIVPGTLTRFPGLATAEQVLAAVTTDAFYQTASAATNVPASALKANTKTYLVGSPAKQLIVDYTAANSAEARRVSLTLGGLAVKEAQRMNAAETIRTKALVDETKAAVDQMSSFKITDPWQSSDLVFKLWDAKTALVGYQASLDTMQSAYTAPSDASVTEISALSTSFKTVLAAGLVGLVLGVALAAVREALLQRRAHA